MDGQEIKRSENRELRKVNEQLLECSGNTREVVCPSCGGHFLGFPALQDHVTQAHSDPDSLIDWNPMGRPSSLMIRKRNRKRKVANNKEARLVCYHCKRILRKSEMPAHLKAKHSQAPTDISKCLLADSQEKGEKLKKKISSALGDVVNRAAYSLIAGKSSPSHRISCGAVVLLTKLCSILRKDDLMNLQDRLRYDGSVEEGRDGTYGAFPCPICSQRFTLETVRNRHMVYAHTGKSGQTEETCKEILYYGNGNQGEEMRSSEGGHSGVGRRKKEAGQPVKRGRLSHLRKNFDREKAEAALRELNLRKKNKEC